MRGASRRGSTAVRIALRDFGWSYAEIAVTRHPSLPWNEGVSAAVERNAVPLDQATLGSRDRLSLLAQYAAHLSFVRFAGIAPGAFDPAEWGVTRQRGADCRLIRIAARGKDDIPALTLAQRFADAVRAPSLEVLEQAWARPEAVYTECFARLEKAAAADLRWLREGAMGAILMAPETLSSLWRTRAALVECSEEEIAEAVEAIATLDPAVKAVVLRGGSIVRYGALAALQSSLGRFEHLAESAVAEKITAAAEEGNLLLVLVRPQTFDEASRRVLQIVSSMRNAWQMEGSESRSFVLSPRLAGASALLRRSAVAFEPRDWLRAFVFSDDFSSYLHSGDLPAESVAVDVPEPSRSYLAALALLGRTIPRAIAEAFLAEFLFDRDLRTLSINGVFAVEADEVRFASEAIREAIAKHNPPHSWPALCRVAAAAAEKGRDLRRAVLLLIDAGDGDRAGSLLEEIPDEATDLDFLQRLPTRIVQRSPRAGRRLGRLLIAAGRYREAAEAASLVACEEERELLLARVERRLGAYGSALARLDRLPARPEAILLRAEIAIVERRRDEAGALLTTSIPCDETQKSLLAYLRALSGASCDAEIASPYLQARLATYRAIERGDFEAALDRSHAAAAAACDVPDRVDAMLDRVYTLFAAGRWSDARSAALETLAAVEETEGDRAGGGLLFLLAYLYADDGQWRLCAHHIERLRRFYANRRDDHHLAEVDLLSAQVDFARGRFEPARRIALALLSRGCDDAIAEAAALIVAESEWILDGHPLLPPPPTNLELRDRHAVLAVRSGLSAPVAGHFSVELVAWEQGTRPGPPDTASRSERLKLFRAALGYGRRGDASRLALAREIAAEMEIELEESVPRASSVADELLVLRSAAQRSFPYAPGDFAGLAWRFAVRNRLGQWQQIGCPPFEADGALDRVSSGATGCWIACSERELLWFEGADRWSGESREAVAAMFHARAELHRTRRLLEQGEAASENQRDASVREGIVGESPAIREVLDLVARIAPREVAVCIRGESGTGKELIARALHRGSSRRSKPFLAVNCGALPEQLIESELFGHVRGAFTGADRDRPGLIEAADGGTLFLDEIAEMALAAQAKLLRFLQEGEYRRVGDTTTRTADVRIVSATNRRLESDVEVGKFREDLYYRIRGVEIMLPPLRGRGGDVALLAAYFLAAECERHRGGAARLSPEVQSVFAAYSWPGNVRELENTIRGAHALAGEAKEVDLAHLPDRMRRAAAARMTSGSYQDAVARFRRDLIEKSLAATNGNQNRAAALLQISRQALSYQIRELGILVGRPRRPRVGTTGAAE